MPFRVVLDACVLIPYQLSDLLLRLAEAEIFVPLWSDKIMAEVNQNLPLKLGVTPHKAQRRIDHMTTAFPLAAVEGYKDLIPAMTNDPKDRHVLAAAVRGNADLIVTANLKDFPDAALEPYGIQAIHPDQFLLDQLDLDPVRVVQVVAEQRDSYTRPELSAEEFSHSLAVTVPDFASAVTAAAAAAFGADTPLPLEIVSPGAAHHAFFPDDDPSPETNRGAAFLWWQALLGGVVEFRPALQRLSTNHAAWGDYSAAASSLHGWAMMQFVESCPDAPGLVAYAKFMPDSGHPMRGFDVAPIPHVKILTVVKGDDGWWRAWGLSNDNYRPPASQVLGADHD